MLSGIGQVTGLTYKYIEPIKAWAIHKAMAYALLVAILIHVGFLLVDNYIRFSIPQIIVPFLSHYNNKSQLPLLPFSSLAIAFGIIATYGILITVASSLKWIDTKKTTWRKLHYINYAVIMLVFLHALYAGSDLKYGLFRAIWILIALIVLLAVIYRLTRTNTLKR